MYYLYSLLSYFPQYFKYGYGNVCSSPLLVLSLGFLKVGFRTTTILEGVYHLPKGATIFKMVLDFQGFFFVLDHVGYSKQHFASKTGGGLGKWNLTRNWLARETMLLGFVKKEARKEARKGVIQFKDRNG